MKSIRKFKRSLTVIIMAAILATLLTPVTASASDEASIEAKIENVYGGAKGIVSMTFDDGIYPTALVLEELCEKYDLKASLMIIAGRMTNNGTYATADMWNELFAKGHLEPQSHSTTHVAMRDGYPDNLNQATYKREMLDSADALSAAFPGHDILTFAVPYGTCVADARTVGMSKYYMMRGVYSGNQTLDPGFNLGAQGSWSNVYSPAPSKSGVDQLEYLKGWVDTAAQGYWYCPYAHRVGDVASTEIPYAVADAWFAYIKQVRDRGDIWVATASEATKYIRERQNSTVNATLDGDKIKVSVQMAAKTADNLPLTADVFDHPLTVRVNVTEQVESSFSYSVGGQSRTADAFEEGGKRYVLIDVIPNSTAVLTPEHDLVKVDGKEPDCMNEGEIEHYKCNNCGDAFDADGNLLESVKISEPGAHKLSDVARVEPTETAEGVLAHKVCSVCNKKFNSSGEELTDVTIPRLQLSGGSPDGSGNSGNADNPDSAENSDSSVGIIIAASVAGAVAVASATAFLIIRRRKRR